MYTVYKIPRIFQCVSPSDFSNVRFSYPYKTVERFSNATFFCQIVSQTLQHKKPWVFCDCIICFSTYSRAVILLGISRNIVLFIK